MADVLPNAPRRKTETPAPDNASICHVHHLSWRFTWPNNSRTYKGNHIFRLSDLVNDSTNLTENIEPSPFEKLLAKSKAYTREPCFRANLLTADPSKAGARSCARPKVRHSDIR